MDHPQALRRALLSLSFVVTAGLLAGDASAQAPPVNTCVSCHVKLADSAMAAPARAYEEDIHAEKGFTCVDCHGGDATRDNQAASKAPGTGFAGRPVGREVLQACGRCHSDAAFMRRYNPNLRVDQVTEYSSSVHGQRLLKGDTRVATCISCHPAHQIRPPGDTRSSVNPLNVAETCGQCHASGEYMKGYEIPTDQLDGYKTSIHWQALSEGGDRSAPTCNDCHGNHGAAPPGVASVGNVCGQCHSVMAEYFVKGVHAPVFESMDLPGCASCHSNHDVVQPPDSALGIGEQSFCITCHSEDDDGAKVALAMRASLDSLHRGIFAAESLLTVAEHAGMEVSQAQFELEAANSALLQAKASIHSFVPDTVISHTGEAWGVVTAAIDRGRQALEDLRFRRVGLALSTATILLLILGLVLKIRQIERPTGPAGSAAASATGGTE